MKTKTLFVLLSCFIGMALSKPLKAAGRSDVILNYDAGTHSRFEAGQPGQSVVGSYSWQDGDEHYIMNYEADEKGYRPRLVVKTIGEGERSSQYDYTNQKVQAPIPIAAPVAVAAADKPDQIKVPLVAPPSIEIAPAPPSQPVQAVEDDSAVVISSLGNQEKVDLEILLPDSEAPPAGAVLTDDAVIVEWSPNKSNPPQEEKDSSSAQGVQDYQKAKPAQEVQLLQPAQPNPPVQDSKPQNDPDQDEWNENVRVSAYLNALYEDYVQQQLAQKQQESETLRYLNALQRAGILPQRESDEKEAQKEISLDEYLRDLLTFQQLQARELQAQQSNSQLAAGNQWYLPSFGEDVAGEPDKQSAAAVWDEEDQQRELEHSIEYQLTKQLAEGYQSNIQQEKKEKKPQQVAVEPQVSVEQRPAISDFQVEPEQHQQLPAETPKSQSEISEQINRQLILAEFEKELIAQQFYLRLLAEQQKLEEQERQEAYLRQYGYF